MIIALALLQLAAPSPCRVALVYRNDDVSVEAPVADNDYLVSAGRGDSRLTKAAVYALDASCSEMLAGYRFQHVVLRDGRAFSVPQDGGLMPVNAKFSIVVDRSPSNGPTISGQGPISTVPVDSSGRFLGVWRAEGKFSVAAFNVNSPRPPIIIATSTRPINQLSYTGAPHEGSGVLDFVTAGSGKSQMLVRYRWNHADLAW